MRDPSELYQDDPHPVSGHRTPREIAEDEAGAIGGTRNDPHKNLRADNGPVRPLDKSPEPAVLKLQLIRLVNTGTMKGKAPGADH
jgi:hypothetical protein